MGDTSEHKTIVKVTGPNPMILRNYKIAGWCIVFANLLVFAILVLCNREFAVLSFDYSFFTLMHLTALTCTIFALKDSSNVMLYPILVSLVAFVIIPLSFFAIVVTHSLYCSVLMKKDVHMSFIDCNSMEGLTFFHYTVLIILVIEKISEFIVFRRLMKMFEAQRCSAHFQATDVKEAFSTNDDTDDEIIVFEKVTKGGQQKVNDYGSTKLQLP